MPSVTSIPVSSAATTEADCKLLPVEGPNPDVSYSYAMPVGVPLRVTSPLAGTSVLVVVVPTVYVITVILVGSNVAVVALKAVVFPKIVCHRNVQKLKEAEVNV